MKKIVVFLACATALVFASDGLAAKGKGGGVQAHLTRIQAHVTKYTKACKVAKPSAKCKARKAALAKTLNKFKASIQAKVTKLGKRSASSPKLAALRKVLAQITVLQAHL